jgi:hypothetical protein
MTDLIQLLSSLRRPRLLIRAARFGMADYNRERDLKRLIREPSAPSPAKAVTRLISEEAILEDNRTSGDATHSVARHVEILIALMAEAKLLPTGPRAI